MDTEVSQRRWARCPTCGEDGVQTLLVDPDEAPDGMVSYVCEEGHSMVTRRPHPQHA